LNETIKEGAMPIFDLRFVKRVPDDSGHDHLACQCAMQVDAADDEEACRHGVAEFCRQRQVRDWTMYADALEMRQLEPSLPNSG